MEPKRVRVCELVVNDIFVMEGSEYYVLENKEGRVHCKRLKSNGKISIGCNSQRWVDHIGVDSIKPIYSDEKIAYVYENIWKVSKEQMARHLFVSTTVINKIIKSNIK